MKKHEKHYIYKYKMDKLYTYSKLLLLFYIFYLPKHYISIYLSYVIVV